MFIEVQENSSTRNDMHEIFPTTEQCKREHNNSADQLSKEATTLPRGEWMIQEQRGTNAYQYYHRPYIDAQYHRAASP